MRVALVGIGRMGRAIEDVARTRGHEIVARIGRGDDVARVARAARAEVAFEFTNPDQAGANVAQLVELGVPTVSGTTGWDPGPALARADVLGTPCLVAPNFSIGMAVTNSLAARAARALAPFPEFEPGIIERHHSKKADVPSGSARMLAAAVATAAEARKEVPVAALRQGSQPGEHQVIFDGPDEEIAIVHRVRSRSVFASGAVLAAEWIVRARPRGALRFEDFLERSRS